MIWCLLFALCVNIANAAITVEQQRILAVAKGSHNADLNRLWKEMEAATDDQEKSSQMQYLLASKLQWRKENELSIDSRDVKYFANINTKRAAEHCDLSCRQKINRINTKINPESTIEDFASKKKGLKTAVHTELLFLFGTEFREELKKGGTFLIYSKFIPCAGLADSSFGECSGDLAAALKELRESYQVYFVIMYSDVYGENNGQNVDGPQRGSTNECTSKLYHRLAGIPLLLCKADRCSVVVGNEDSFVNQVQNPEFQSFPRVHKALQPKVRRSDVFLYCLAKSQFLEMLGGGRQRKQVYSIDIGSELDRVKLKLIEDMLSALSNPSHPERPNIQNTGDEVTLIQRNYPKSQLALEYGNHCVSFIDCLPHLRDGPPTIFGEYGRMDGDTKESDVIRKRFCNKYAHTLTVLGKPLDLCSSRQNKKQKIEE